MNKLELEYEENQKVDLDRIRLIFIDEDLSEPVVIKIHRRTPDGIPCVIKIMDLSDMYPKTAQSVVYDWEYTVRPEIRNNVDEWWRGSLGHIISNKRIATYLEHILKINEGF